MSTADVSIRDHENLSTTMLRSSFLKGDAMKQHNVLVPTSGRRMSLTFEPHSLKG